jgi:hypothetical protein
MKKITKEFTLFVLLFSLLSSVYADETAPATCGKPVLVKGGISHYKVTGAYTVANATDNSIYSEEVFGSDFTVCIQSIPKGNYKVEIYMAEAYHNSPNQRVFNIWQNGLLIAENLDIYAKVGKNAEYRFTYSAQLSSPDLEIRFKAIKDMAKFNALKVLNEDGSVIACVKASELTKVLEDPGTGNPIVWNMFTADPSAHVFNGKMYVYPSHDLNNAQGFNMRDYHVFSSTDMLTWNDHGVALDVEQVPWAKEYMWAPDCVYKNGTYYFYFPAKSTNGEFKIGVATSTSPTGPFKAEPEPIKGSFSVDPAVFIDTDGKAYMYFGGAGMGGQTTPWVAKLDNTMKQFDGEPQRIAGADYWFEACWMSKIGNTYYLSYSTGSNHPEYRERSAIAYATADNPMGPFKYRGVVNGYVSGWTNHQSMVEYKGQWYFFYHNADLSGGNTTQRSICADYLHINDDGTLSKVVQTKQGVGAYDGLSRIEAENYHETIGAQKKQCTEGGFSVLFDTNDTLAFNDIEFKNKVMKGIQLRVAGSANGVVEIISGDGKKIGTVKIDNATNDEAWKTCKGKIGPITGTKNILLVYKSKNKEQLNLNWIEFD